MTSPSSQSPVLAESLVHWTKPIFLSHRLPRSVIRMVLRATIILYQNSIHYWITWDVRHFSLHHIIDYVICTHNYKTTTLFVIQLMNGCSVKSWSQAFVGKCNQNSIYIFEREANKYYYYYYYWLLFFSFSHRLFGYSSALVMINIYYIWVHSLTLSLCLKYRIAKVLISPLNIT